MPNLIDANGLQVQTRAEWLTFFTAAYQRIYGADVNLDSDSPDGQMMNIDIQVILDIQDLLVQIYNMFDPDNAIGVILDQRVAINGIQRQGGTFTITDITVVNSQSVNLYGKDQENDQDAKPVFTVSDNAGNLWELQATVLGVSPGTHVYSFQAAVPGQVLTIPNTITIQVTIVLGVDSVNNPTPYTTLGINEETDAQLKLRRQKSVSLSSQGYLAGLLAALENITGMTSAFVYENNTSVTNGDGVPGHSIWVITSGTAAPADIAQAIYTKRNAGCGMFGQTTYTVIQVDGSPFVLRWDTVITEAFFITFNAASINGINAPNLELIRSQLPVIFTPGVNDEININTLATLVQQIDPNTLVTGSGFTLGLLQIATLSGIAASGTFEILYNGVASAAINWNDSLPTIQSKVAAVAGLTAIIVTGSIASQTLSFDFTNVGGGPLGLITIVANSLQTSGLVAITFAFNEGYTNTLQPSSKRNQLITDSANIIILPMILNPSVLSIPSGNTQTYVGLGGYGVYVYSFQTNNSGGTIDPSTGLYTAGPTANVTDTLKVTDAFGNTATAIASVT